MGACQECWVMVAGQGLKRACSTLAEAGMQVVRR
jgi:predicted molibdopterin-dependent oxidoreductase YjgC